MTACLKPLHLKTEDGHERVVPCGRCNACLVRSRMEWSLRLQEEARVSKDSYFITLTYDNDHLPILECVEPDTGACFYCGVVDKKDVQNFNKRFRKYLETHFNTKTRFYLISEYGPQTLRPHYHGIYFMDSILSPDDVLAAVASCWPSPNVTVDCVTDERIRYVTEYALTRKDIPSYLVPNFRLMSNRPGLGAAYVGRMSKWHLADVANRFYSPSQDGHKVSMPRYYRNKIYDKETLEERSEDLSAARLQEEILRKSSPDFDPVKDELDRRAFIEDYNRRTNFFLNKKAKKL